jgi:hypothetical protein
MAHGTFGFEIARAIGSRSGTKDEHDRESHKNGLRTFSLYEGFHFALPPFLF